MIEFRVAAGTMSLTPGGIYLALELRNVRQ